MGGRTVRAGPGSMMAVGMMGGRVTGGGVQGPVATWRSEPWAIRMVAARILVYCMSWLLHCEGLHQWDATGPRCAVQDSERLGMRATLLQRWCGLLPQTAQPRGAVSHSSMAPWTDTGTHYCGCLTLS